MSRLTFITLLSIISILVAIAFNHQQKPTQGTAQISGPQNAEPDFYLLNAKSVEFDQSGKLRYRFNAQQLDHFPKGDYTLVKTPDITLFHNDGTPWYINARQGRITAGNESIKLWDQVVIIRDSQEEPMKMETRTLTIIPKQDIAKTEQDVVITNRAGRIDATGMITYVDENRMELLSNVRVRHEPIKIRK
ncbi:MAG: LPS export ABC transporter periplasmic protein LptC [Pseudomonadales bacterium]|nr:LPS export ABC transporter periplasmic protein LptC [Pseudomonadales bacterium]